MPSPATATRMASLDSSRSFSVSDHDSYFLPRLDVDSTILPPENYIAYVPQIMNGDSSSFASNSSFGTYELSQSMKQQQLNQLCFSPWLDTSPFSSAPSSFDTLGHVPTWSTSPSVFGSPAFDFEFNFLPLAVPEPSSILPQTSDKSSLKQQLSVRNQHNSTSTGLPAGRPETCCPACLSERDQSRCFSYRQPQQSLCVPRSECTSAEAFCQSTFYENLLGPPPLCYSPTSTPSPSSLAPVSTPPPFYHAKKRKSSDGSAGSAAGEETASPTPKKTKTKAMRDGGHSYHSGSLWVGPENKTPDMFEAEMREKRAAKERKAAQAARQEKKKRSARRN